jgi:rod shape-determining protein MreC
LFGQVVEVSEFFSRVLLVTDSTHAVPVQVNRNGVRSIAAGTGQLDRLELEHVPITADIKTGDLLVSSGLGGRFPPGYPVGEVVRVEIDPARVYAEVIAQPLAALDRSRHVLLIFDERSAAAALEESAAALEESAAALDETATGSRETAP